MSYIAKDRRAKRRCSRSVFTLDSSVGQDEWRVYENFSTTLRVTAMFGLLHVKRLRITGSRRIRTRRGDHLGTGWYVSSREHSASLAAL